MFLRMKATKQKTEQKLQKIEEMCSEQIIHMKEQSDLMKFVTETLSQNDSEMRNCSNVKFILYLCAIKFNNIHNFQIMELLQRFSWLLFENSKLRYKMSRINFESEKMKNENIAIKNLEESSMILNKLNNFEMKHKFDISSISLDGSESTVFNQKQHLQNHSCCFLRQSKSVAHLLPY